MTSLDANDVGILKSIVFVIDIHVKVSASILSSGPATCM